MRIVTEVRLRLEGVWRHLLGREPSHKARAATLAFLTAAAPMFLVAPLITADAEAAAQWSLKEAPFSASEVVPWEVDSDYLVFSAGNDANEEIYLHQLGTNSVRRITSNAYQDTNPAMDAGRVAWMGKAGAHYDIFLYSAATKKTTRLTTGGTNHYCPRISGNYVVWAAGPPGAMQVFLHNLLTGTTFQISSGTRSHADFGVLGIDGNYVAWHDSPMPHNVLVYEISSGTTVRLHATSLDLGWCQVRNGRVIYMRAPLAGSGVDPSIGSLRIVGREISTISSPGEEAPTFPIPVMGRVLSSKAAVWEMGDSPAAKVVIRLHRFGSGQTEVISEQGDNRLPQIGEDIVGWIGRVGGVEQIFGYDMARRVRTKLTSTAYDNDWLVAGANRLAWRGQVAASQQKLFVASLGEAPSGERPFVDVHWDHYYREAIEKLYDLGIVQGKRVVAGKRYFAPQDPVNRAQFTKMIVGTLNAPVENPGTWPFLDLGPDDPADPYPHQFVAAAYKFMITKGVTATEFRPWQEISRAGVVTMIIRGARAFRPGVLPTPPSSFKGSLGSFSPDHAENMRIAEYHGLLTHLRGFGPSWDPWQSASRAEVAQLMYSYIKAVGLGV